jgi:hypothetical protein
MDKKLRHQTDEELAQEQQMASSRQQRAREFGSVEEMLRHDAEQVAVPPHLAVRVKESVGQESQPKNWWGRLFNR